MEVWVMWTIFLPITLPLEVTKFCVSHLTSITLKCLLLCWSAFCLFWLVMAALIVYIPVIGEKAASLCLIPSKVNTIPKQPFFWMAVDMLKLGGQVVINEATGMIKA